LAPRRIPSARIAEQLLDDHAIAPHALELAVTPVDADDAKAGAFVKRDARGVLREDPRHELPEAASGVRVEQGLERRAAGAGAARLAVDVDRMLGDAHVGRPATVRAGARPGDHEPVALDHDRREAIALVGELRGDLCGRARLGL